MGRPACAPLSILVACLIVCTLYSKFETSKLYGVIPANKHDESS